MDNTNISKVFIGCVETYNSDNQAVESFSLHIGKLDDMVLYFLFAKGEWYHVSEGDYNVCGCTYNSKAGPYYFDK